MADMGSHDSTPYEPLHQPDGSSPQFPSEGFDIRLKIALGVIFLGVVAAAIAFYRLEWNCRLDSRVCSLFIWFIGPYVLLSLFTPLAWRTGIGKVIVAMTACLVLLPGGLLVYMGKPPSAPGAMTGLHIFPLLILQYALSAVGVIAIIVVWAIVESRRKPDREYPHGK